MSLTAPGMKLKDVQPHLNLTESIALIQRRTIESCLCIDEIVATGTGKVVVNSESCLR